MIESDIDQAQDRDDRYRTDLDTDVDIYIYRHIDWIIEVGGETEIDR